MPLDPQAEALLKTFTDAGAPPMAAMTVFQNRIAAESFTALIGEPEEVSKVDYQFIPGPTADLPVRIYRPVESRPEPMPGLVYFHGGGWTMANIGICDSFSRSLANRTGCVVVAVNYQKAPEHKFPVPMDDCYAATEWVFNKARELGLDSERIGVIGDSAGGNLAAAVALRARDEGGPKIACQVLVYPAVQYGWDTASALACAEGYFLERLDLEYFWNLYVSSPLDGVNPYCSPLAAEEHKGLPPTFIVCAEFDPLTDDGCNYADKLTQAGVPVKFSLYPGMIHGFLWMSGVFDQSKALLDEIGQEVRSMLAATE